MPSTGLTGPPPVNDITISREGICTPGKLTMCAANGAGTQDAISLEG